MPGKVAGQRSVAGEGMPWEPERRHIVEEQLERLLENAAFKASRRSQLCLRYVVQRTLDGQADLLKERTIGVDVFGRPADYDTSADAVVRVTANDVRKRLAQYYLEAGREEPLRIDLPSGAYVPEFHWLAAEAHSRHVREVRKEAASLYLEQEARAHATPPAAPVAPPALKRGWRKWLTAAVMLLISAAAVWQGMRVLGRKSALEQFWAPVFRSERPVTICLPEPIVYALSKRIHEEYRKTHSVDPAQGPYALDLKGTSVPGEEIYPTDQYIAIGDAQAIGFLSGLFARMNKPSRVRVGKTISFADIRDSPTVLVGAFSNHWMLERTKNFRLVFEYRDGVKIIRDLATPERIWSLPKMDRTGKTDQDFAIVSRIFDPNSGQFLIQAGGITQYGTQCAGELLTNATYMAQAVKSASSRWANENIQILAKTTIVGGTPGPPQIVAVHSW